MITIAFDGGTVRVPEKWEEVTLGLYERVLNTSAVTARERVDLIAQIVNCNPYIILEAPASVFNYIVGVTSFIFEDTEFEPTPHIEVDGVKYFVSIDEELTLGEWVDIEEAQKRGGAGVMAEVLAIVCRPPGEEYDGKKVQERKAVFSALPIPKVAGVLAFFLMYNERLERQTQLFSTLQVQAAQLLPNIRGLLNTGGGIKSLTTWRGVRFSLTMLLLACRLRRSLHICNFKKKKVRRLRLKGRSTAN